MPKTVGEILDICNEIVPNRVNTTTKVKFLNDILAIAKKYNTEITTLYTTGTMASTAVYSLPSYVGINDILYVGISGSTFNTTTIAAHSTTIYLEYKLMGQDDPEVGLRYKEWSSSSIQIIPMPDDEYYMVLKYKAPLGPYSSTADPTTDATQTINVNDFLTNYIQDKLCSKIAKTMAFPRLDLANNYELDAMDNLNQAIAYYYRLAQTRQKRRISYKRWW
jgi:hypothetical protein